MQIPDVIRQVLSEVKAVFPSAIIAGGALRDLDYGRPIKDVDIFINTDKEPSWGKTRTWRYGTPFSVVAMPKDSDPPAYYDGMREHFPNAKEHVVSEYIRGRDAGEDRELYSVYKMERDGVQFEIIFGDSGAGDISRFDMSICQIAWDGELFHTTPHYEATKRDGVIRVVNERPRRRQAKRIKRMQEKFPEMQVVDMTTQKEIDLDAEKARSKSEQAQATPEVST